MKNLLILVFCLYTSLLSAQTNDKCNKETKRDSVFMTVAQMPEFCGGEIEMHKYINENLCVPKSEEGDRLVIWMDKQKKQKIEKVEKGQTAYLVIKTQDFTVNEKITVTLEDEDTKKEYTFVGSVDSRGIANIEWTKPKEQP